MIPEPMVKQAYTLIECKICKKTTVKYPEEICKECKDGNDGRTKSNIR